MLVGNGSCLQTQEVAPQDVISVTGSGYLSSLVASQTGYGSARCPVTIAAQKGQRINVALLDFTDPSVSFVLKMVSPIEPGKIYI